jgi:hypothetical protein
MRAMRAEQQDKHEPVAPALIESTALSLCAIRGCLTASQSSALLEALSLLLYRPLQTSFMI